MTSVFWYTKMIVLRDYGTGKIITSGYQRHLRGHLDENTCVAKPVMLKNKSYPKSAVAMGTFSYSQFKGKVWTNEELIGSGL